jgi:heme exporter protein A
MAALKVYGCTMITVENLTKQFGAKPVLRGIDFHVKPGEFVALLGPNGAGKTTFLRILASLTRPNHGTITIDGYRLSDQAAAVRRHLGVVLHQPLLYGELTAEENLRFYGRMYALPNIETRIDEILELVGLSPRRSELVRTFSRGMQQRLSIGRALLHDPPVMLLDEPHTGLDQDVSVIFDSVLEQVARRGYTVVMTSHDLIRAAKLADRFDILAGGKIVASQRSSDIEAEALVTFYRQAIKEGEP